MKRSFTIGMRSDDLAGGAKRRVPIQRKKGILTYKEKGETVNYENIIFTARHV